MPDFSADGLAFSADGLALPLLFTSTCSTAISFGGAGAFSPCSPSAARKESSGERREGSVFLGPSSLDGGNVDASFRWDR